MVLIPCCPYALTLKCNARSVSFSRLKTTVRQQNEAFAIFVLLLVAFLRFRFRAVSVPPDFGTKVVYASLQPAHPRQQQGLDHGLQSSASEVLTARVPVEKAASCDVRPHHSQHAIRHDL